MRGTEEKGVDVRIATDMISLAWAGNYDVAVLASSDRDFVPLAEFLATRGTKVIHGRFPPQGAELAGKCWGEVGIPEFARVFGWCSKGKWGAASLRSLAMVPGVVRLRRFPGPRSLWKARSSGPGRLPP